MKNLLWRILAKICSIPIVANAIINQAKKTPYSPILGRTDDRLYMERWWLFNKYSKDANGNTVAPRWKWLPSIRVHHICLPDDDEHEHDHPWDARTIILDGWYLEQRNTHSKPKQTHFSGDTFPIMSGQFHRIDTVSHGGVYTLFFTWKEIEDWGFWVDGKKQPWREYLATRKRKA